MRSLILFSTKLWYFLAEIPLIFLFVLAIMKNGGSSHPLKLIPLIIITGAGIIFVFLYYARGIIISYSEVRHIGLFSERDKAMINEGKTLILTLRKRGNMRVVLFGNNGEAPLFPNNEEGEEDKPVDFNLFKGLALGRAATLKRILRFFDINEEDRESLIRESCTAENEFVKVESTEVDGRREIRILFTATV